jgi:23S rRNA (cytosine1962-C5)-methyltransferase
MGDEWPELSRLPPVTCHMPAVTLKPGRETSVARRHPWIFSGAIAGVDGNPEPGATVEVRAPEGTPLALGAYSPRSQIAVRIWTFDPATLFPPRSFATD